jgi:hypothetical protein
MIQRSAFLALAVMAAAPATGGCAAGTEGPDVVGYVLLDRDARAVGHLAQADWQGSPVLPVALDAAEPVAFESPTGRTLFDLRPGMLAHVHGAAGSVDWLRVGDDMSPDRLRVYGSKDSASDLARRLAGSVEGGGDGLWTVAATGILDRASFLQAPDGVVEVVPDAQLAAAPAPKIARHAVLGPVGALPQGEMEGVRQAMVVGVYTSGQRALFLDASGGFSLEDACSGDVLGHGRFRTEDDHVVLDSDAAPMVLAWDAGELRDPGGGRFAPLVDAASAAAGAGARGEP